MEVDVAFRNMATACHNLNNLDIQNAIALNQSIHTVAEARGLDPEGKPMKKEKEDPKKK